MFFLFNTSPKRPIKNKVTVTVRIKVIFVIIKYTGIRTQDLWIKSPML